MDEAAAPCSTQGDDEIDEDLDPVHDRNSLEEKLCPICRKINHRKALIGCTQCGSQYHRTCVNISKVQVEHIPIYI